jgi:hypothetical protein
MMLATGGICPSCLGSMTSGITTAVPKRWEFEALPYYECSKCGTTIWPTFGDCLLFHPDVREFCLENGLDPLRPTFWTQERAVSEHNTSIRTTEPWRIDVALAGENERLVATLDGDLDIVAMERP